MEEARLRLGTGPASPAREEGIRQITADLSVLGRARGSDLDEVRRYARQADQVRQAGQVAGAALGLGLGGALALQVADPITMAVVGAAGAATGAMVLFYLGRDAGQAVANRFVQATGVGEVVQRWTESASPLPTAPSGRQNAVTDLLHEVRGELCTFPEGPDRTAALQLLDQDLATAGKASGTTLPELQQATDKRERLVQIGSWTGIGVGVLLSGALVLRASQGLVDPLTAIRGTILGSGLAMTGAWQGGKWLGGKLGDRHQVAGMKEVLERWQPVLDERARQAEEARSQATALVQGGEKASIALEQGGLRVGGVLLRVPKRH